MSEEPTDTQAHWTRRNFLTKIGQVGGSAAVYETMVALGLINLPPAWAGPPTMKPNQGLGKSVVILGAGIGGLTTAYLLSRFGYRCQILEASARAGGRNHTARRGSSIIEESEAHGVTYQECHFDNGLYLNLGPGRLPYHHRRVLGYCRELNVALEPYIMNTTGNLFQTEAGFDKKPVVYRRIQNDARGYIAELLAKCVRHGDLDHLLSETDSINLLSLLSKFGPLDNYAYTGSTRDGCARDPDNNPTPNVFYNCQIPEKIQLAELLTSNFWEQSFYSPVEFEWQPTLFQPVGGMDKIVEGFVRQVCNLITYNAPVSAVAVNVDGVAVTYQDGADARVITADYCVSNIPCPILRNIPNNFAPDFVNAVNRTDFSASCKVGWQCNTRFWEKDGSEIYGGISWTDDIIEQIWYPSNDYFGQKGTLTGAYIHDGISKNEPENATTFGNYDLKKRLLLAKRGGYRLHKEFKDNSIIPTELGLSIAWQHVVHQKGAWPSWSDDHQHDNADYTRLLMPDRRFYIVGDQASTLPGWQEGAMMSAEHVVELIGGLKPHIVPDNVQAPDTIRVTQGLGFPVQLHDNNDPANPVVPGISIHSYLSTSSNEDGSMTLLWKEKGALQQASAPSGPWHNVENAASPHTIRPNKSKMFYRLLH